MICADIAMIVQCLWKSWLGTMVAFESKVLLCNSEFGVLSFYKNGKRGWLLRGKSVENCILKSKVWGFCNPVNPFCCPTISSEQLLCWSQIFHPLMERARPGRKRNTTFDYFNKSKRISDFPLKENMTTAAAACSNLSNCSTVVGLKLGSCLWGLTR